MTRTSRAGLAGQGRRSMGLGPNDPRARRSAQAMQREGVVARGKGLVIVRGRIEVDANAVAKAIRKAGS